MPFSDHKPGNIEAIMDIFVEDFLNFPTTQELGGGFSQVCERRDGVHLGGEAYGCAL